MILENIIKVFSKLFKELILVVKKPEDFADWDIAIVEDIIPEKCALAGLYTGLFYSSYPYSYIAASDTPFVNQKVIEYIIKSIEPGFDVIIPRTSKGVEPLSAVYSKDCIPLIENNIKQKKFMIKKFYRKTRVKEIPMEKIREFDPQMNFNFNINTLEDLDNAKAMACRLKKNNF